MITILRVGKPRPGTGQSLYGVEESDQGVWWFRASREVSVWLCLSRMGVLLGGWAALPGGLCLALVPRYLLVSRDTVLSVTLALCGLTASKGNSLKGRGRHLVLR